MNPLLTKIKGWWIAATPGQRLTTLGGSALTVVLVLAIVSYATKPKYTMLFGGLTPADQAGVVTEVQALGIPVQYDTAGTVEVPEGKAAEVRMRLAQAGKLPKSSHPGNGDLGAMNLYTTPAVERERLKTILEGELARSIETVPGVQTARVHLTLGDPSPFGDRQRAATASVNVVQGGNGILTSDQSRGIAMLVANGVDGLEMKNVVVLNERMEPIFNGEDTVGTGQAANKKLELEREVGKTEERKLQAALDTMFGPGATLVTVRAEIDLDEEDSKTESHKTKEGVEVEVGKEKAPMVADGNSDTVAGAEANMRGTPASSDKKKAGGTYVNEFKKLQPGYVNSVVTKKKATGGLKRMLINVAANTAKFKDEAESASFVQSVDTFVRNEFKNQADTASFQALVTPVKFDTSAQEMATKAQEEASGAAKRQQYISLLPVAALLVVGFFVVRSLGKFSKPGLTPALAGMGAGMGGGSQPSGAMALGTNPATHQTASNALPASSPLEAALSNHFEENGALGLPLGGKKSEEGGIQFESDDERIRITKIKERTSIPLEQIRQMSTERPEAVAMLVKSWLLDEKR